ncbi:MAG: hypothetical protein K5930_13625 [Treponemataceae bacterium]|nr:hypothetical protein [Treponemataceae bacterium]
MKAGDSYEAVEPDVVSWKEQGASDGGWSIPLTLTSGIGQPATGTLNEGHWYLYAKTVDKAGNESEAAKEHFHVDQASPVLAVTSGGVKDKENGTYYYKTDVGSLTLNGTASDSYGIQNVVIETTVAGGSPVTSDVSVTNGNWTHPVDVPADQAVALRIRATDKSGKAVEKRYTLYRDMAAPVVTIISPAAGESLMSNTKTLRGTASDAGSGVTNVSYSITKDGESVTTGTISLTGESWSTPEAVSLGSGEGTFVLSVTARDALGNETTGSQTFYVDTANPTLSEEGIGTGGVTTKEAFTLRGRVSDSNALAATGALTITADKDGFQPVSIETSDRSAMTYVATAQPPYYEWTKTFTVGSGEGALDDGTYVFTVTAKDVASKTTVVQRTITVDTRAPAFTASEAGSIIDYTDTGAGNIKVVGTGDNAQTWFTVSVVNLKVIAEDRKISDSEDAEEGSGLSTVKYETSDGKSGFLMKSSAAGSNEWSTSIPLNEGSGNGIRIIAVDAAGNTTAYPAPALDGTAQYETIRIDTQNPTISLSDISDLLTGNEEFQLNGSASDGSLGSGIADVRVSLADSEGAPVSGSFVMDSTPAGGNWAITFRTSKSSETENKLSDGRYLVTITAEDKAGRTASVSKNVTVDTSAPAFVSSAFTSTSYPNSGSTGSETWYGSSSLDMSGVYTDSNSIETVMWSWTNTAGSTWHSFDKSLSGNNDSGYTCSFSGTVPVSTSLKNGSLYIKALDKAGNESAPQPVTGINVDIDAPTASIQEPAGTPLLNGKNDLPVKVSATDVGIGIKQVSLKIGSQDFSSPDSSTPSNDNGVYTLSIAAAKIAAIEGTQAVAYIQTKDYTDKTQTISFSFKKDTVDPESSISMPYANTVLNKTVTVKGTASDDQELASVKLYYSTAQARPASGTKGEDASTAWKLLETYEAAAGYNWSKEIDTTADAYNVTSSDGKKHLHFMSEATDKAQNCDSNVVAGSGKSSCSFVSCTVDQLSDCPVITFSNITADDHGLLKSTQTIFGTIEDDDGNIKELRVSSERNASWDNSDSSVCDVKNGSWSYTDTGTTDGDKVLYFRVKDAKDSVFVTPSDNPSDEDLLRGIYISGTEDNPVKQMKALKFRIDMNPPQINQQSFKIYPYKSGDTSVAYAAADTFSNNMIIGGTKNLFDFFASSYDANGIRSMSVKIGNQTVNGENTGDKDGSGNYIWKMSGVNVSQLDDDSQNITVTAVDAFGSDNSVMLKVRIDNTAPTFSVTSHQTDEERKVTGIVTLRGTASDTIAGVKSIKYMIPTSASAESIDASTDTVDNKWHDMGQVGTTTWKVEFKNYQDTDGEEPDLTTSELKEYCNSTYAEETSEGSGIWKVPVYFRMEDIMGNAEVDKSFMFFVNPDGDKPTAEITYPVEGARLGGTIRIFGSAEDNEAVGSVYMQIDDDGNGSFDDSDKEVVAAYQKDGVAIYTVEEFGTETPDDASDDWWGIKVSGKESWNQTINAAGEFNPESNAAGEFNPKSGTKTINIRVRAKDLNGLLGAWSPSVSIEIDKNAPRIGSSSPLKLVQYDASGNVTAMQDYQTDISIKGNWYLTGSAEDESGIKEISVNPSQGTLQVLNGSEWTAFSVSSDSTPIIFRIPINTTGSGAKSFEISAKENTDDQNNTTSQTVSIKYDNTAPTIGENLNHNKRSIIGDGKNGTIVIEQSNKTFSIEGTVEDEEGGSGFSRLAIYFKRVGTGSDPAVRTYNPAIGKDETGNRTNIDGSTIKMVNDLPTFETVVTRGAEDSLTLTGTLDPNIRAGGLVRIGGVYRRITSVSGNTVSFTPSVSTDYTTAEFVYALVVDNFKIETPVYDDATGALTKISNDDGDGVIESIEKIGTICEWSVSIDSKQIPDGPIDICCVAFDTADNFSDVKSVSTSVQNNRPAIANVWLGTDYDRDNSVKDNEFVKIRNVVLDSSDLLNYDPNWKSTASSVPLRDVANEFKAVGATVIKTEVIGGNRSLHFYYAKDTDSLASFRPILSSDTETAYVTNSSTSDGTISKINFKVSGEEGSSATLDGLPNGIHSVYFRIYDTTENLVTGQDTMTENTSQWASFAVKFNVNVVDEVPPEATIKEFYWNGKNDNSLYNNSTANGHIELKADLEKVAAFNATSGLMDTDPKVSGIIKIQGTAKDETCLQSIWLKIDNYPGLEDYTKVAAFSGGTWSKKGIVNEDNSLSLENGYSFFVTDPNGVCSDGHEIQWELSLDTSLIDDGAATDIKVNVKVFDTGKYDNSKKAVYDENGKVTSVIKADIPSYRMDIVPYITGVKTSLSSLKKNDPSVYSRTVAGHYPVAAGEEKITITGFNLTGGTVTFIPMDETVTDEADYTVAYSAEGITIPEKVKSGEVSIVVNEIESLNNKNGNESKGAYSGVVDKTVTPTGDKDIYDNYYNRQPNGDNNNLLTDDVVFDIWDINSSAAMTNRGLVADAVMKINPKNGMIGFAFSNGPDYFCMPNGSTNSYVNWQRNYDDYYWTALAYDDKGRTFGTTVGRDINSNSNHGGKFSFLTSVWGLSKTNDTTGNYKGGSQRRLECIGAPNGAKVLGTATTEAILDKTRIRSPSLAVAGHGDDTSVYLAYYDDIYQQIRFRYAKTISAKVDNYDQIYDDASTDAVNVSGEAHYSIISGYGISDYSITDTPEKGIGEYVSIAVIPGESYEKDVVVAVWYDNSNDCTWYSYKVNPCNDNDRKPETEESGYWSDPVKVFQGAGQYCQVAVGGNGIHVAAYDGTDANLVYAYMSSYSGKAFTTCTVDSYSITGTRITLDVVNTGTSAAPVYVPYIGYYMSSTLRPKMAYLPGGVANLGDGVDTDYDTFTYRWESTLIPTTSTMVDERINVATWKDKSGLLKTNETTKAEISEKTPSAEAGSGTCYGNGSNNPVMGYAIKKSTTGFIETAQMR